MAARIVRDRLPPKSLFQQAGAAARTDRADETLALPQGDAPPAVGLAQRHVAWRGFLASVGAVAGTVCIAWAMSAISARALGSLGMIFLVPVLVSAVFFGRWPAFFTAFISVMAYNFFFLPPLYTFTIADPNNWLSFAVLLFVAIIAGDLAARVRVQADLAAARAIAMTRLYRFTGKLAGLARLDEIARAVAGQIAAILKADTVIFLENPATGSLETRARAPGLDDLGAPDLAAAARCRQTGRIVGPINETGRLFLPMCTGEGLVAIAGILRADAGRFSPDERRLMHVLLDQAALAIDRCKLVERADEARVLAKADKLRVAMLSSLSHDLRTPLASILGAATTLVADRDLYDRGQTDELLKTIREESERLDRFVGNLLDMSRLEAGVLGVKPEALDLKDLVETAIERLGRHLSAREIAIDLPPDLPLVHADPLLLEQAIFNLLDNAAKYSPPGSVIRIHARSDAEWVFLAIADEGTGIPPDALPHIFEKFYRARASDKRIAGTGLGLAVARGFVEAFGGSLEAANRNDRGGAILTISLPITADDGMEHAEQIAQDSHR